MRMLLAALTCASVAHAQTRQSPQAMLMETGATFEPTVAETPDTFSIDLLFPNGGSATGNPAMGARWLNQEDLAIGAYLQFSRDRLDGFTSLGLTTRLQYFLTPASERARPYAVGWLSAGRTLYDNADEVPQGDESPGEKVQAGMAAGFGVEIHLVQNLSASAETGLACALLPSDHFSCSTMTSQVAVHFLFDSPFR